MLKLQKSTLEKLYRASFASSGVVSLLVRTKVYVKAVKPVHMCRNIITPLDASKASKQIRNIFYSLQHSSNVKDLLGAPILDNLGSARMFAGYSGKIW